jgi:gliding motility-associated-like protein
MKKQKFDTFVKNEMAKQQGLFSNKEYMNRNNYFIFKTLPFIVFLIAFLFSGNDVLGQCAIQPASQEGCLGSIATFTATGNDVATADAISWDLAGNVSTSNPAQFNFPTPGTKTITLTVTKGGNVVCTQTISYVINRLPVANISLGLNSKFQQSKAFQCYKGNEFCFDDASTLGEPGNTLTKFILLFGDGAADSTTGPGGKYCHTYFLQTGGKYSPFVRVIDNKGCVSQVTKVDMVEVDPDMQNNYTHNVAPKCQQTVTPITNWSQMPISRVHWFKWDFGDGNGYTSSTGVKNMNGVDSCYWQNPTNVYKKHGCFDAVLYMTNDSMCSDTVFKKSFQCNINPEFVIDASRFDAQCYSENDFTFTHNIQTFNWPVTFIWNFDDPDSGPANFDDKTFNGAQHSFSKPDLFIPSISGRIAGCPFSGTKQVTVKGPIVTIEVKPTGDIINDTMRHQCQIKDTLFFKNNSAFFLNDRFFQDDVNAGAATSIHKANTKQRIGYLVDTALYSSKNPFTAKDSLAELENVIDYYKRNNKYHALVTIPLSNAARTAGSIVDTMVMYANYFGTVSGQRRADHVRMVWDFADNVAPRCTTWTKYNQNVFDYTKPYYHYDDGAGNRGIYDPIMDKVKIAAGLNIIDTTYAWMNCNFSRDIVPKHWYTPGEEMCYNVVLRFLDTTMASPMDSIFYANRTKYKGTWYDSGAVMNKDIIRFESRFRLDSIFDYPPLIVNGDTAWNFNPNCVSEKTTFRKDQSKPPIFLGFRTIEAKEWLNPNIQRGDQCEGVAEVPLALMAPDASMGLRFRGIPCYGPVPPYGLYFSWADAKPGCTQQFMWFHFDSTADRKDATPNVFDKWVDQNGTMLNPVTPWPLGTLGLPNFPTTIFRQYTPGSLGDSCGWITVGLRLQNGNNPHTNTPCIDEAWYHRFVRYTPNDSRFTVNKGHGCNPMDIEVTLLSDVQDSLEAISFTYANTDPAKPNDVESEVDSVYRRKIDPITGDTVNYIITYKIAPDGTFTKIDSISFIPGVGGVQGCGTEVRFKKKRFHRFERQGRYAVIVTASNMTGCVNFNVDFILVGFHKEAWADKRIVCKNETVSFFDSALYFLKEPDPFTGDILLRHAYWRRPEMNVHPDGTPRLLPMNQREKTRWDFDEGAGWIQFLGSPTPRVLERAYKVPGYYTIRTEFTDSLGCKDTIYTPLYVSGASANFRNNINVDPNDGCKPIVTFFDESTILDPCAIQDNIRCDSIIRWIWNFGDGKIINTNNLNGSVPIRNPVHYYNNFGDYDVTLIVETALGCFDTIKRAISIEGPRPRFEFAIDSVGCAPYTVYLRNISIDPKAGATWTYNFGNGAILNTNRDTNVYYTYLTPGTYNIMLEQLDGVPLIPGLSCQDSFPKAPLQKQVRVLPERKVDFTADRVDVCPYDVITFTSNSDTIYDNFQWIFGDGDTLTTTKAAGGDRVTHFYKDTGVYVVRLRPTYTPPTGDPRCNQTKSMLIRVKSITAEFDVDSVSLQKPSFRFNNKSVNAIEYWWDFGDGNGFRKCPEVDPVNCPDAVHNFGNNLGIFNVCLLARSPEGCYDTICKPIYNFFEVKIDIPNVFTPNGDGFNDTFKVKYNNLEFFEMSIFNRWGTKMYETTDPNVGWGGTNRNDGRPAPAGVYYVTIKYRLRGQVTEQEYNGTVTLIRN